MNAARFFSFKKALSALQVSLVAFGCSYQTGNSINMCYYRM